MEIATPLAAVAAGEWLRKEPRGIWTCVSLQSTRHNYNYNSYNLLAIISIFGLHLSKIHSRCYTNRQRRRVRRRLNVSVINTGGGAHWTGGHRFGLPTSCYLWTGPYDQTAKFWREKWDFFNVECNKSEWKVNLGIRNSTRSNRSWRMTTYTVS